MSALRGFAALSALLCALALPAVASAADYLPNPSFEGSLSGWAGWQSTLSLVSGGHGGLQSALVRLSSGSSYSILASPRPVASTTSGTVYTATAWEKSAAGVTVCLRLREYTSGTLAGSAQSCVTGTNVWLQIPSFAYTAKNSGSSLDLYAYQPNASAGASFQLDDVSLTTGTSPPPTGDKTPPTASVTAPAAGATVSGSVALAATASDDVAVARVEFLVDGALVGSDTSSPYGVAWNSTGHANGGASIVARAVDSSGNAGSSTARAVTVSNPPPDTTPPETTITAGPSGTVTGTTATFSFASSETGSTFRCSLDGSAFASCSSPVTYSGLALGGHTFQVAATDTAGNADATPASRTWTIQAGADTTPPETTITAGPSGTVTDTSASFSFASSEAGSTFRCSLDGAAFAACGSPHGYSGLAVGSHTFQVAATDVAGNADPTPASRTWTMRGADPVLALAGDQHACEGSGAQQTANLLATLSFDAVASLGDASGDLGTAAEYANCYQPTWGRWKSITRPAIGNHDYASGASNGEGYFGYFGAAAGDPSKGYYSYDLGPWHVVVLNSYCGKVDNGAGCGAGSPQVAWLKQDLAAHPTACTLAYWHHPLFTSSPQPGTSGNPGSLFATFYAYGGDVVVNAHVRMYERFAPQDGSGNSAPQGVREFVSGAGGGALASYSSQAANSEVIENSTFGVLLLTLHTGSYDWRFVPVAGGAFAGDAGSASCH